MSRRTTHTCDAAVIACCLFKLLRLHWLTRREISEQMPLSINSAHRWVAEMTAQGMLIEREGPKQAAGYPPKQYTLAPEWGGQA
jgi:predicted transcriptional regulator